VAVPLVLLFHGSNRNGLTQAEKWKDLAEREGLIIAAPDSLESSSWRIPHDGPAFLRDLVDLIKGKRSINPRQVYLFGHSGGAKFAILMALYESEYFAASAVHAGSLDASAQALPDQAKRKIPIQLQVGSRDHLFPVSTVRATRDVLVSHGFQVELIEIPGHDHWYYDRAPKINDDAWTFLKAHTLPKEPRFEEYRFKDDRGNTGKAVEHYMKGIQRHQATDRAGAIAAYTKAIELDAEFADAYNNRGVVYLEQQNLDAALADFTKSLELGPSVAAYNNRANLYFSQKKFPESIKDYSAAIDLKPLAESYINRGTAYWQTDQHELAFKDFERAVEMDPKSGRAHLLRGLYYLRVGKSESAQQDFDKGFSLAPELHGEFDPIIHSLKSRP
jgi:tetratricopeptide (TPR) repeat protein